MSEKEKKRRTAMDDLGMYNMYIYIIYNYIYTVYTHIILSKHNMYVCIYIHYNIVY